MNQIIYRLLHGLQRGSDNVTLLWVLVRCPAATRQILSMHWQGAGYLHAFPDERLVFSVTYKTVLGSTKSLAQPWYKAPTPPKRGLLHGRVGLFFTTHVHVLSHGPPRHGSQHTMSRAVVGNLPSRISSQSTSLLHTTLTSQEMTVTLQHGRI